ncbi:MAG: hypothetical protein DRI84_05325 [Bacteroidetes bacterium]|nr:MAG: hypothetical protein DRI84_05325 [Bacteroidota bacterium]
MFGFVEANTYQNPILAYSDSTENTLDTWTYTSPDETLKRRLRKPGRRNIFQQGKTFIAIGYGYPNLSLNYMMTNAMTLNFSMQPDLYANFKNKTFGVIHFRYEYAMWDIFGLSFRGNFSSYDISWDLLLPDFDNQGNQITRKINSGYSGITMDMVFRFDWHIVTNMKIDLYTGVGLGYSLNTMNYYSSDEDLAVDPNEDIPHISIPVAFEGTMGIRYFFTPGFGMYAEFGYAQSIAEMGFTFRF